MSYGTADTILHVVIAIGVVMVLIGFAIIAVLNTLRE